MIGVGHVFPRFSLKGVVTSEMATAFETIDNDRYADRWLVVFFWPKDFTFVCPTEIAAFGALAGDFNDRDAQLLGVSIDSEFVHLAWRQAKSLYEN